MPLSRRQERLGGLIRPSLRSRLLHASVARFGALLTIAGLSIQFARIDRLEAAAKEVQIGGDAKLDSALVRKLIEQLESPDFPTREKATQELSKLNEVPEALRAAAKSNDIEVRRRAQAALDRITKRLEEKAFQSLVANLHKVELDRFVRRMVADKKFAGDKEWEFLAGVAKAVTRRAHQLGGMDFPVPNFDVRSN